MQMFLFSEPIMTELINAYLHPQVSSNLKLLWNHHDMTCIPIFLLEKGHDLALFALEIHPSSFTPYREHFVFGPSQWETTLHWETTLQCNIVSHCQNAYTKLSLPWWYLAVDSVIQQVKCWCKFCVLVPPAVAMFPSHHICMDCLMLSGSIVKCLNSNLGHQLQQGSV